jgi:hypothetical protein
MERELTAGGVPAEEADHFASSIGPVSCAMRRSAVGALATPRIKRDTNTPITHRITGSPDHRNEPTCERHPRSLHARVHDRFFRDVDQGPGERAL